MTSPDESREQESPTTAKAAADLETLRAARAAGPGATLRAFVKLSGPGWLQSAITLGGGSLASSLYLGVLAGFGMLWLQPLAMALGIVMLSAIGYVVLSTRQRPFAAVNEHVNPVLGWGWALASLAANMVWAMPQYALATSVVQQNLAPGVFGADGVLGDTGGKAVVCALLLAVGIVVTWSYDRGSAGIKLFERVLKAMVAIVVLCFFGVVVRLATSDTGLDWGAIAAGFVPDFGKWSAPAESYRPLLDAMTDSASGYWTDRIVGMQRDVMISAAATAVGINMTFLLPYSMLAKGWSREFRGLAGFDLATGMLIPFLLATSCVVVAAANRFHTEPVPGLVVPVQVGEAAPAPKLVADYERLVTARAQAESGDGWGAMTDGQRRARVATLPIEEKRIAAMLVKRDAFDLARALEPLTGGFFANVLFGIGVLGMALSTITLLMLISGFVICEILGLPPRGRAHRLGCLAAATGVLGPFVWGQASFYLAVPTSVFGMALLPIAYWSFFFLMNSRSLLGDDLPRGGKRVAWNALMLTSAGLATAASLWSIDAKAGLVGWIGLGAFLGLAGVVHVLRRRGGR